MTDHEQTAVDQLTDALDGLIDETEAELGRELDDDERESVIDEALAGLDEDEDEEDEGELHTPGGEE